MNWKEHANIFANGKFKVRAGKSGEIVEVFEPYINDTDGRFYHKAFSVDTECTLIARHIEDMTEDEWEEWNSSHLISGVDMYEEGLTFTSSGRITYNELWNIIEYPLSIGVYPFDQSDFGETVIDIKTIDQ